MSKRTFAFALCATLLMSYGADARRRTRPLPPPQPQEVRPTQPYDSPDDLPEPQRSTYQVLHAYGKE